MLSESQERMVFIVKPEDFKAVQAIGEKWDLIVARIGSLTEIQRVHIVKDGQCEVDLPA